MVCIEECPFEAYSAMKHEGKSVVELNQERCANCGLCIMACVDSAITMGGVDHARLTSFAIAVAQSAKTKNLAFICERSVELGSVLKGDGQLLDMHHDVAVIALPCIGALTPSLVNACHGAGAKNVLAIGCQPIDCHYRVQRRRVEFTQDPDQKKLLVEQLDEPYFKTIHTSRFEGKLFLEEVEKFIDQG